jgi:nicotinamidase-related amidase
MTARASTRLAEGARARTLLLLIDLQRAFCDGDGSMAMQGRNVAPLHAAARRCQALATLARARHVPVVWTRMVLRKDYGNGGMVTRLRPNLARVGALRAGTTDVELSKEVHAEPEDAIVDKPRYSAVYATALEAHLRARAIERVIVGGVTTSMCIESSVRDLSQRDYEMVVVKDACGDFDASRHEASLSAMEFGFARLMTQRDATRLLGA